MKLMQPLDVGGEATSIFFVNLDLIREKSRLSRHIGRDSDASIYQAGQGRQFTSEDAF